MTARAGELPPIVRAMTESDIDAVSAVRVSGWRYAYAGLMPRSYLDGLDPAEDAARRRESFDGGAGGGASGVLNLVAEARDGSVVGWAALGPARGEEPAPGEGESEGEGELYALYARPDLIGTGIGRALMDDVLRRSAPYPALCLWVVEGNARARRFYERAGFRADGAVVTEDVGGVPVRELRYRRT